MDLWVNKYFKFSTDKIGYDDRITTLYSHVVHLQNLNFKGIDHCGHLMLTRRSTGDVDQWPGGNLWIEVQKA